MKLFYCALLAAGCGVASATPPSPPQVTPELRVPDGHALSMVARARGVQIYSCRARTDAPRIYEWVLRAPEAELFDDGGRSLGTHYAGPTWKLKDGSQIVGEVRERAPSPAPGAVPWLLLAAKKSDGRLTDVRWIQRVNTKGGSAPQGGCDAAHVGTDARSSYEATYTFWSAASH